MAGPDLDASTREQRLLTMLDAISRSLSGALSVPDTIAEIAGAAGELLEFRRMAVLLIESENTLRVHAAVQGVVWPEGRLLHREECSPRLWINPQGSDRVADTLKDLDPAFPMDREIIERGTRGILRVPLASRSGPIGVLAFSSDNPDSFTDDDERTASAIAGLVAMALEHERLLEEQVHRLSRQRALDAFLPQVAQARDLNEIGQLLWGLSGDLLPHDVVTVIVVHSDQTRYHMHVIVDGNVFISGEAPPEYLQSQIGAMGSHDYLRIDNIDLVNPERHVVRLHLAWADEKKLMETPVPVPAYEFFAKMGLKSQLRVAVRRGPAIIGVLGFGSRVPRTYDEEDVVVARRLAGQVSLTLAHDRLTNETKRAAEAGARATALENRVAALQRELEEARGPHAVVGLSKSWQEVLGQATRVAGTDTTVLLTGESGTGKEVVARFLHHASPRSGGPFVAVNCAALPEQLLEGELFGHEKGAFTGATGSRPGRVEQAAGGVLFLDEVGEISPNVQAKFLRVLQEREFQRLGSSKVIKADVRVIAATNRDLRAAIRNGEFREDLYYRLHVFAIHLPPLRERPEDILALADHFIRDLGATLGHSSAGMTAEARDALKSYSWPGNARELRNVIERALILSDGGLVHPNHLAFAPVGSTNDGAGATTSLESLADGPLPPKGVDLEALERSLIKRALVQVDGNKSKAARLLGLSRAQLYSRLEKYGL